MNVETLRNYVLQKAHVTEETPFGPDNLVYKIGGKMFMLISLNDQPLRFNVKCNPERALQLRESHSWILPGYHMNKKHWNTVIADIDADQHLLLELIDHSYNLVYESLPAKIRKALES